MEIDEQENPSEVFSNLENRITSLKSKIKSAKGDEEKFELIDRNDIKNKLRELFNSLLGKYLALLKKCLHSKPSQITNGALTQETCVRLLTLGVQQSYEYAKQIAVEFNYFSEKKNWLEKFLLMARSDLREMSIEFLISYLRYTHVKAGGEIELDGGNKSTVGVAAQNEQLALVKRILFKTDADSKSSGSGGVGVGHSSSLIHCLFVHIASDSRSSIDFLMQELYFKFVQNDAFNKSERIRLFNDRTLSHLIKLYSWKEEASEESDEDNTMTVREIINEFLKTLFCSTRYGINFYDKTFSLDMSSERNCNHLIFTTLINLPRFSVKTSNESIEAKTNELIDELILKTLKVCPDLIQRFFKVKQKQESNKKDGDQFWLIRFCIKLFDQQQTIIHSMAKNPAGSSSYLRSLCSQESTSENTNLPDQLMTLIAYTSVPLTLPFPRLIQPVQSPTWRSTPDEKKALLLTLLVSCLKCLKEWRYCLSALRQGELSEAAAPTEIELRKLILDSIKKIYDHGAEEESFHIRFSIELAAKYLPNKEVLVGIANNSGQEDVKSIASDALALFSEVFEKQVTDLDQVEMFNAMNLNHENNNEEKHQTENGIKNGEEEEDEEEEEEEEKMDIDDDLPDSLDKLIEAYSYTMSRRDLRILRAIRSHDPSLNCLLFKLLETNSADTLSKQAKVTDFISLKLNDSLIYESIVNFPLSRKLDSIDEIDGLEFNAKIYDPIYMLPNLYNLLDYSNVVDVVEFPHSKLLSYLFASLSSECDKLRTLAYSSIYRFVSHLENSRAYLKNILLYMVNFLRNSIEKKNQRLSTVISVFLAETVLVVIKPGTVLYRPLTSFLLVKPSLDLYVVPEFYKLFNSSSMDTWIIFNMRQNLIKYKVERKWIMNVIAHSCRTTLDYRVIEKRFVFRQLLGIYVTRMCDNDLKDLIVRLIERVCGIKYALIDLVKRQHFLIWLTGVITEQPITSHVNYQNDLSYFIRLMGIFNRIWAMLGRRDENKSEPLNERKERKTEDEVSDNEDDDDDDEEEEEEKSKKSSLPPVTFVNQMHLIARQFISKLEQNQKRFVEIKTQERLLDEKRTSGKMKEKDGEKKIYTVGDVKKETVELFKVNREIIQVLKSYDVILPKTFEDNLDGLEGKIKRCLKRGKINSK